LIDITVTGTMMMHEKMKMSFDEILMKGLRFLISSPHASSFVTANVFDMSMQHHATKCNVNLIMIHFVN